MAKYRIAIADKEEKYLEQLLRYMTENERGRMEVERITEHSYLEQYLKNRNKGTEILLISPEFYDDNMNYDSIKTVIILNDGKVGKNDQKVRTINKYQRADKLIEEIIHIHIENDPEAQYILNNSGNCKVLGFYSPIGKSGKTVLSVLSATSLADSGKRVFYLNLEDFPSTHLFFDLTTENAMSDVMYFAKEKKKNFVFNLLEKCEKYNNDNLFVISPLVSASDNEKLDIETWEFFFTQLKRNSDFDYVIVDFSSGYNDKLLEQLNACDKIIFFVSPNELDRLKVDEFYRTQKLSKKQIDDERFIRIMNQYSAEIKYETPVDVTKQIPYIKNLIQRQGSHYTVEKNSIAAKILKDVITKI